MSHISRDARECNFIYGLPAPIFTMLISQQQYVQIFYIEYRPKRTITVESNTRN